jgi:hypothetical protein
MSDQTSSEIHPREVESEIKKISAEILRQRERPEGRGLTGPEIVRQAVRSYTGVQPAAKPKEPATAAPTAQTVVNPLPDYAESAPPEVKREIERFLEMAFRDGILKASSEAAKSTPFVLDAFHDALAGKLYEELKKRGIVE